MATTLSLTTSFSGEAAAGYISASLLSGKTINDGAITVKPNVKYKEVIRKAASDANIIKDATCDFTDTGTITLTERILQPEEFQVNLEFCKKDFVEIGKLSKWAILLLVLPLQHLAISSSDTLPA